MTREQLLYFVGGFVAGCVSGYLIAKGDKMIRRKRNENDYRYRSMGESVAAGYADGIDSRDEEVYNRVRRWPEPDSKVERRQNASVKPIEAPRRRFTPEMAESIEQAKKANIADPRVPVSELLAESEAPVEESGAEELENDNAWADAITRREHENHGRRPRIISAETLSDLDSTWDSRTLYFYSYDAALTTEEGELIENIDWTVGDCLEKYGFADDPNQRSIIVQNFDFNTVYEIEKVFGEFL